MKKFITILLATALLLTLTACGGVSKKEHDRLQEELDELREQLDPNKQNEQEENNSSVYPIGELITEFPEPDENGVVTVSIKSLYNDSEAYKVEWKKGEYPPPLKVNGIDTGVGFNVDFCSFNLMGDVLVMATHGTDIYGSEWYFFNKSGEKLLEIGEIGNSGLLLRYDPEYAVDGNIITITVVGGGIAHGELFKPFKDEDAVLAEFEIKYNMSDGTFGDFKQTKVLQTYKQYKEENENNTIPSDIWSSELWRDEYMSFLKNCSNEYAVKRHYVDSGELVDFFAVGFAIADLDNNGISELIIAYGDGVQGGYIFADIYSHMGYEDTLGREKERVDMYYKSLFKSNNPLYPGVFVEGGRSSDFKCYYWTIRSICEFETELLWVENIDTQMQREYRSTNEQLITEAEAAILVTPIEFLEINDININSIGDL